MQSETHSNIIVSMMSENVAVLNLLSDSGDVSLQTRMQVNFVKILLISAFSYFEKRITDDVIAVFRESADGSDALAEFVRQKAVTRRFHEWFEWDKRNANRFFNAFGPTFGDVMQRRVEGLNESVRAFLELGQLRNQLVHGNFATFSLDKTLDEVFNLYRDANRFVEGFPEAIREHIRQTKNT